MSRLDKHNWEAQSIVAAVPQPPPLLCGTAMSSSSRCTGVFCSTVAIDDELCDAESVSDADAITASVLAESVDAAVVAAVAVRVGIVSVMKCFVLVNLACTRSSSTGVGNTTCRW